MAELYLDMTLKDYINLDHKGQRKKLWEDGVFVELRIIDGVKFALYAIDLFFVEVTMNTVSGSIMENTAFDDGSMLDKYSNISALI
jgi:hypothetical protein